MGVSISIKFTAFIHKNVRALLKYFMIINTLLYNGRNKNTYLIYTIENNKEYNRNNKTMKMHNDIN